VGEGRRGLADSNSSALKPASEHTTSIASTNHRSSVCHANMPAVLMDLAHVEPPLPHPRAGEVHELRRRLDGAEMALSVVQRAHTEAVERGAMAQARHKNNL
jgi:hypothetical protein